MMQYLLNVTKDDDGSLLVTCPAFPEVTTFAVDETHVAQRATAAIEEAIAARIHDGDELPRPRTDEQLRRAKGKYWVKLSAMTTMKALLYMELHESGVTRAALARQLHWHREQVDRLFRLDHASKVDQIEAAFGALHRSIDVRIREIA
jgi:antitoxin HicB